MAVRVLLDTCAVRNFLHSRGAKLDVPAVVGNCEGLALSIADAAFAELVSQLLEGRLDFADWSSRIHALDAILDPQHPIFPGGNELALLCGLHRDPSINLADSVIYYQQSWAYIRGATSVADLKKPHIYSDSTGPKKIVCNKREVQKIMNGYRKRWAKHIHAMKRRLAGKNHKELLKLILEGLQPQAGEPADFAQKLDCVARCHHQFIHMAMQKRDPYNPDNLDRRGDIFDIDLLYALALPAVICTADKKFRNRIIQTKAKQAKQVVLVGDFNGHVAAGTVSSLLMP